MTTSRAVNPERLFCKSCSAHSRENGSLERVKAIQAISEGEDIFGTIVDDVVYKEHLVENGRLECAEQMVNESQATLRYSIAGIALFVENAVIALFRQKRPQ